MAKINDKIAIYLSVSVLAFLLGAYITDNYLSGLVFAILAGVAALLFTKVLPVRQKGIGVTRFTALLLLEGKGISNGYLHRLYPPREEQNAALMQEIDEKAAEGGVGAATSAEEASASTRVERDNAAPAPTEKAATANERIGDAYWDKDGRLVVNALGYGKAGEEWAAKIYRALKPTRVPIVVATTDIDRRALATLGLVATQIKILRPKEMLRRLEKMGVDPTTDQPPRRRLPLKAWVGTLTMRHTALFAMSAASSLVMSLWSPIKVYFYVFAAVNALLAIGTTILKKCVKE